MRKFNDYQKNLKYDDNFVYSYGTKIIEILPDNKCKILGHWSVTTTRHSNYAIKQLNLKVVE